MNSRVRCLGGSWPVEPPDRGRLTICPTLIHDTEGSSMDADPRMQQLLDELLDSDCTPEEVCRCYPELLPAVQERWRQIRRVADDLDALFPPLGELEMHSPEGPELPTIPGYQVEAELGRGGMG